MIMAHPPPVLTLGHLTDKRLSIMKVPGDLMAPTLRGGWDYVIVWPTTKFLGDALYVMEDEAGGPTVWQGQWAPEGVRLSAHNPAYSGSNETVPREWFNDHVLGVVVADLKVRDLRTIVEASA